VKVFPWQQTQWQQLMTAVNASRLPHALLLAGPKGIGLTHFSHTLVSRLLCRNLNVDSVCGTCNDCVLLESGNHPDVNVIQPDEPGKQIRVEQIRDLIGFIQLKSHYGKYKLAIIEPAEAMNRSAANALLKTLEEPPDSSLIVLNTHQAQRLPVTIRSRCQRIEFKLMRDEAVIAWLRNRLGPDQDIDMLLQLSGAPFAALEMVEEHQIQQRDRILEDLETSRRSALCPADLSKSWVDMGVGHVIMWLQHLFMDMLQLKIAENPPGLRNTDLTDRLRPLLNGLDLRQILSCSQLLARIYAQHTSTVSYNSQAMLEEFVFFWQSIETSGGMSQ